MRRRSSMLVLTACIVIVGPLTAAELSPQPTIELVQIIDGKSSSGVGKFWSKLTGKHETGQLVRPYGLVWLDDDLLVTDPGSGHVVRVSHKGKLIKGTGRSTEPIGVATCGSRIFVTDSRAGTVEELDDELRHVRWLASDLVRPTGIVCDGDDLVVAETGRHRILRLSLEGRVVGSFGERGSERGEFNFPVALGRSEERLLVSDTMNFRIQSFDWETLRPEGSFGRPGDSPGDVARPKGLAVDRFGNVWLADAFHDQVSIFDADGRYLGSLGSPGSRPGEFAFPTGVAFDVESERAAVVDSYNRRIQVFRISWGGGS